MRAFLFSISAALLSCSAAVADDYSGKYSANDGTYNWSASIKPRGRQSYKINVKVNSEDPPCIGEADAIGKLQGGKIIARSTDTNLQCALAISKSADGIDIQEKPGCTSHGASCGFESHLKRVGQ